MKKKIEIINKNSLIRNAKEQIKILGVLGTKANVGLAENITARARE